MSTKKVKDIKKLDDGRIAVKWVGSRKYSIIQDPKVAEYLVYMLIVGKDQVNKNQNSMCR